MYEQLRQILGRLDELKDKQALFVLSPQEHQELSGLLRQYQVKVQTDHPELFPSESQLTIQAPQVRNFQIYLKTGKVISARGTTPEEAVQKNVPEHLRKEVEFCDPDKELRYKWSDDTKTWVYRSIVEKA